MRLSEALGKAADTFNNHALRCLDAAAKCRELARLSEGEDLEIRSPWVPEHYKLVLYVDGQTSPVAAALVQILGTAFTRSANPWSGRLEATQHIALPQGALELCIYGSPGPGCRRVAKEVTDRSTQYELVCE